MCAKCDPRLVLACSTLDLSFRAKRGICCFFASQLSRPESPSRSSYFASTGVKLSPLLIPTRIGRGIPTSGTVTSAHNSPFRAAVIKPVTFPACSGRKNEIGCCNVISAPRRVFTSSHTRDSTRSGALSAIKCPSLTKSRAVKNGTFALPATGGFATSTVNRIAMYRPRIGKYGSTDCVFTQTRGYRARSALNFAYGLATKTNCNAASANPFREKFTGHPPPTAPPTFAASAPCPNRRRSAIRQD
jgi:hypothetical protein